MDSKKIEEFLKRAAEISSDSGCVRSKRGAVFVKDGKILIEAFNTVLPDNECCKKGGCLRDKLGLQMGKELEKCRAIHAEAKAIVMAAKKGIEIDGATAFITCMPCINCAKLLAVSGIKEIYYLDIYGDKIGEDLLKKMGIKCERVKIEGDDFSLRMRDTNGQ